MQKKKKTDKQKLIDLYNESLKTGVLKRDGLCNTLLAKRISRKNLKLFKPKTEKIPNTALDSYDNLYWGSGIKIKDYSRQSFFNIRYKFTPLRQTILAFLIAMED